MSSSFNLQSAIVLVYQLSRLGEQYGACKITKILMAQQLGGLEGCAPSNNIVLLSRTASVQRLRSATKELFSGRQSSPNYTIRTIFKRKALYSSVNSVSRGSRRSGKAVAGISTRLPSTATVSSAIPAGSRLLVEVVAVVTLTTSRFAGLTITR
jgi:hypothetical protein